MTHDSRRMMHVFPRRGDAATEDQMTKDSGLRTNFN